MNNNLLKIAALPSGPGCLSSLPPEVAEAPPPARCTFLAMVGGEPATISTEPSSHLARMLRSAGFSEEQPTVHQMKAPYFAGHDELAFPPIDHKAIPAPVGVKSVKREHGPELYVPKTAGCVDVVFNFTVGDVAAISQVRAAVAGSEARRSARTTFIPPIIGIVAAANLAKPTPAERHGFEPPEYTERN